MSFNSAIHNDVLDTADIFCTCCENLGPILVMQSLEWPIEFTSSATCATVVLSHFLCGGFLVGLPLSPFAL